MDKLIGTLGRLRFALVIGLLACPVAVEARVRVHPSAPVAPQAPAASTATRLERILELIEDSNAPEFVGRKRWGQLVEAHRPALEAASSHRQFAEAVNELFQATGVSHFHYFTDDDWFYWHLRSTFGSRGSGCHVDHIGLFTERIGGRWFVRGVLEGSVAESTPIRVGDELLSADGQPFEPVGSFRGKAGQPVHLRIRRKPDLIYNLAVTPVRESLHQAVQRAIRRSIRVIEQDGYAFAYLHAWSLLGSGEEYQRLLRMQDEVDGLLLDFRDGFGGLTGRAMRFFFGSDRRRHRPGDGFWRKPAVVLIADGTRSAKEIVVDAVQRGDRALLVGTATPGHVISVGALRRIDSDGILMLPGQRFALEGHPTKPDVLVERDFRYAAGADPQLRLARELLIELIQD